MKSTVAMTLFSFGLIFLSFGFVVLVIDLVGTRFGAHHKSGMTLALGFLLAGGVAAGTGILINRSRGNRTPT